MGVATDFDGFIYDAASAQHTEVFVTSFHCCASMFSFYSAAADVDDDALAGLSASQPPHSTLLGWFVCRSGTMMAPSIREQAVSASLADVLSRRRDETAAVPLLFALCSAGQQQGGATCSFQYRFFQHSQAGSLEPLRLVVANAGASPGRHHAYERPSALTQLPTVPAPPPPPVRRKGDGAPRDPPPSSPTGLLGVHDRRMSGSSMTDGFEIVESPSASGSCSPHGHTGTRSPLGPRAHGGSPEAAAVRTSAAQAAAIEAVYQSILAKMESLAPAVSRDLAAVAKLSDAVAELQDQIH